MERIAIPNELYTGTGWRLPNVQEALSELSLPVTLESDGYLTDKQQRRSSRHKCVICGEGFSARRGARYCSAACRQKAYYQRQVMSARVDSRQMSASYLKDVLTVSKVSPLAAENILELADTCGADVAAKALDAVWDVLVQLRVDLKVLK